MKMSRANRQVQERQAGKQHRRHKAWPNSSPSLSVLCSSSSEEVSVQQAHMLDIKSRATSSVWCVVALDGGACPSCVASLRRRLKQASDSPCERQTRWDQQLSREAQTVRSIGPRQPHALRDSTGPVTEEEQEWRWEETERSGGATGQLLMDSPVGPR